MARSGPRPKSAKAKDSPEPEDTKRRIIEAALESLHADGIMGASARAIARRGGFNQALIFYHFGGVNELLLAAVDELSSRRTERYGARLSEVSSLRELVAVAGELHREDLEEGHMTVLSQMLAGATTAPEMRAPLRARFQPWIEMVEASVVRAISGTPYAELVPTRDLAQAVTALFVGLELLLNLEEDSDRADHRIFDTIGMLAGVLEAMMSMVPAPPIEAPRKKKRARR